MSYKTTIPTIYGDATMAALRHGTEIDFNEAAFLNYVVLQQPGITGTPLNSKVPAVEAFNPSTTPETRQMRNRYFIIGTGAHVASTRNPDQAAYLQGLPHKPTHSGPFLWVPFKLIALGPDGGPGQADLTGPERQKYVMRRFVRINGQDYIGYWVKRLPFTANAVPTMHTYTVTNNVRSPSQDYITTESDVRPDKPDLDQNGLLPNTGRYYDVRLSTEIQFTVEEINDIREVASIMFGDPNAIVLSEVGLVNGIERNVFTQYAHAQSASREPNTDQNVGELAGSHVACWISMSKQLAPDSDMRLSLNLGSSQPEFEVIE